MLLNSELGDVEEWEAVVELCSTPSLVRDESRAGQTFNVSALQGQLRSRKLVHAPAVHH